MYLALWKTGMGVGSILYTKLFKRLSDLGYHVVIGSITLRNPANVASHEKFGMEKAAHFKEIGFKFGNWVDVGYWQGVFPTKA